MFPSQAKSTLVAALKRTNGELDRAIDLLIDGKGRCIYRHILKNKEKLRNLTPKQEENAEHLKQRFPSQAKSTLVAALKRTNGELDRAIDFIIDGKGRSIYRHILEEEEKLRKLTPEQEEKAELLKEMFLFTTNSTLVSAVTQTNRDLDRPIDFIIDGKGRSIYMYRQ